MPELYQTDGNYEAYLSQLFNPLASGAQFNPGGLGAIGTGIGLGAGTVPNMAGLLQNPWGTPYPQQFQYPQQQNSLWPQQQQLNPFAQQNQARQVMQTIQHAQAVQALKQLVHNLATQSAINTQAQLGGVGSIYGQIGPGLPQPYGLATQNPIAQAVQQQVLQQQVLQQQMLQQQALQQIAQYLATQQPTQFRYGLA
jgi:hypothetical protein